MRQIYPDLWETSAERPLPTHPDATCHAYLLVRASGNVLFYAAGRESVGEIDDDADLDRIAELGGVSHIVLAHWHEVSPSVRKIRERFGAKLVSHARDAAMIEKRGEVPVDVTFWDRHTMLGDIEAIPTPGHTVGSACFLHKSPHGRTYLFAGDTIGPEKGSWAAGALEDDPKQSTLKESLDLLRTLRPDVVIAAAAFGDSFKEIDPSQWPAAIDSAKADMS